MPTIGKPGRRWRDHERLPRVVRIYAHDTNGDAYRVSIKLTDDEHDRWKLAAAAAGMTLSEFVRTAMDNDAVPVWRRRAKERGLSMNALVREAVRKRV